MNIVKKAYCRIFQTVFKLAIPILPYRSPEILNNTADAIKLLKSKGHKSVLIVTDAFLHNSGMIEPLKASLTDNAINYSIYDKTVANPTVLNVEQARELYIKNKCDAIIGFGGGSSIDCAKAVGARIARPNKQVSKMKGILKILKKTPFMIAIPTTAGTGSEVTVATVITDGDTHFKFPISDFPLIPDAAVLYADLTRTLPKSLTATTGMDALTHAVEAFIGRSCVKSSREDAIKAVKLIVENIEVAYNNGDDMTARQNMLNGAFLAGRAFSKSYVGYCHAVAHSLGGKYNIPHGLANAVLLPYTLEIYGNTVYKKLKTLAVVIGIADAGTDEETAAKRFIKKIEDMNNHMDIPNKLSGIKAEDLDELASHAEKEANPLYPVPKLMTKDELKVLYLSVMEN